MNGYCQNCGVYTTTLYIREDWLLCDSCAEEFDLEIILYD